MSEGPIRTRVAIIGGGFSGAAVAWHLMTARPDLEHVVVIEPRDEIGRGVAYGAVDPSHRINVPAARMTLRPEEPEHFARWLDASGLLDADPAARMPDGRNFPARHVFGRYVADEVAALGARVLHLKTTACEVQRGAGGYRLRCADGSLVETELLVLAVAHPPPGLPARMAGLAGDPRLVADPWRAGALDSIAPEDRVLIVGTGLTMADIVAGLDTRGHEGPVTAISRRGLRSRGHPARAHEAVGDFAESPARTVRELVRRVRAEIERADTAGISWHAVLDAVRQQGGAIWQALPLGEKRRLVRHLRPFWDVHRFRIAPQVEAVLDRRLAECTLHLHRAGLVAAEGRPAGIAVRLRLRDGREVERIFDAVVLATGPAHGRLFDDDPLLSALKARGLAGPDPVGLGIAVDGAGRALGADGTAAPDLFVAGPLARGTFGELMGLPEVTRHAVRVAEGLAAALPRRAASAAE
ncbi:FAD-dependent oxidoreductase [Ancylobacter sp. 6x-1]|uniref:FAD-dependent oxidoreductase n=1 Tax=Ancylobacter crimeensis TaxID=2579147 RepID=A0ABT0DAG8_9HYPH|nr:FAD-dependent oxidoreductase [Ancylobacter crimeensis]